MAVAVYSFDFDGKTASKKNGKHQPYSITAKLGSGYEPLTSNAIITSVTFSLRVKYEKQGEWLNLYRIAVGEEKGSPIRENTQGESESDDYEYTYNDKSMTFTQSDVSKFLGSTCVVYVDLDYSDEMSPVTLNEGNITVTYEVKDPEIYWTPDLQLSLEGINIKASWNAATHNEYVSGIEYMLTVNDWMEIHRTTDTEYVIPNIHTGVTYTVRVIAYDVNNENTQTDAATKEITIPNRVYSTIGCYIDGEWKKCLVYTYNGVGWVESTTYYYDGSMWKTCSL